MEKWTNRGELQRERERPRCRGTSRPSLPQSGELEMQDSGHLPVDSKRRCALGGTTDLKFLDILGTQQQAQVLVNREVSKYFYYHFLAVYFGSKSFFFLISF